MKNILLVIGASSDIGVATIKRIIDKYDIILAHYNHMNSSLECLYEENKDKVKLYKADLSDIQDTEKMIISIKEEEYYPNDIIHFPAQKIKIKKFYKTKWEDFQKSIDISIRSLCLIIKEFIPYMIKKQKGKIVVMLSMVVNNMPPKYNSDYVMTKYALLGLIKSLAVEYGEFGIAINGVSPAMVETKFIEDMHELIIDENAKSSPTGRNLTVEQVVPTIEFLLSEQTNGINGQNILITSGR